MTAVPEILQRRPWVLSIAIAILCFCVYALTHAPTVQYTDNGELAAAAVTLGVAHPTGYPLFTLLAHVWSMISTDIGWMNLLAGVWCAIAVGATHALLQRVLRSVTTASDSVITWSATAGAGMLGWSGIVWAQATSLEVYSLHLALLTLTLLCIISSWGRTVHADRWSVLAGLLYGLMLANHLSSVFLAPGLFLLWLSGAQPGALRRWYLVVGPALLGIALYAILPLRSAQHPPINWGMVHRDWDAFLYHVKGTQFGVWMFSDKQIVKINARILRDLITNAVLWIGYIPFAVGLWTLLKQHRGTGLAFLAIIAGNLGISLGYSIPDIDPYFLPTILVAMIILAVGLSHFGQRLLPRAAWALAVLPCIALGMNYSNSDRSSHRAVGGYTQWVFAHAEPNAIIITRQWDYFCSAAWYEQTVRNTRTDVAVIDKELFRRTWYAPYLLQRYPAVMRNAQQHVDAYMPLLAEFELDGEAFVTAGKSAQIQPRFVGLLNGILNDNSDRPLYITPELLNDEPGFAAGWDAIPAGPLVRLIRPGTRPRQQFSLRGVDDIIQSLRHPRERLDSSLRDLVVGGIGSSAMYHLDAMQDTVAFRTWREHARRLAPLHPMTARLESIIP